MIGDGHIGHELLPNGRYDESSSKRWASFHDLHHQPVCKM